LGVREQIEYLGNVPMQQLAELYRNATALVYCSAVGPDNLPPLEAMSVGCPVITADIPGAREQYGDAAIYFSPTNEIQLAECIKTLLDNAELRKSLIEKGLQRAARWTSVDYVNSVLKILDEFAPVARMWEHCEFVCA
jgi:glycosyltransferase involved in cell wall biosynthesis